MSARIATLRLARREIRRHKWRSLLIVLLILIPVAAGTTMDLIWRTADSTATLREQQFGGADAIVYPDYLFGKAAVQRKSMLAALPPGSRAIDRPRSSGGDVLVAGRSVAANFLPIADLHDPLVRNVARLVSGQGPSAPNEAAVTRSLAQRLGLLVNGHLRSGATVSLRFLTLVAPANSKPEAVYTAFKVTGLVQDPFCLDCELTVVSPRTPMPYAGFGGLLVDLPTAYEGGHGRPLTALAALGLPAVKRDSVISHQLSLTQLLTDSRDLQSIAVVTLVAGLGLLEIALLAGTAFAVGARRQGQELGLLCAQGAAPRDLRRVVVAQGVLLAGFATAAAVGVGFSAAEALRPAVEWETNHIVVGTAFGRSEIALIATAGLVSGLLAAALPAFVVSRRPPIDALRARFAVGSSYSRRRAMTGSALTVSGFVAAACAASYAGRHNDRHAYYSAFGGQAQLVLSRVTHQVWAPAAVLVAVFVAVTGLLLLMPAALAGAARLGHRLPPTLRLAVRDASRHQHRTGPATGAIAVAVAAAVAISCLIASAKADPTVGLFPPTPTPPDTLVLDKATAVDQSRVPAAEAAALAALPGSRVLPVPLAVQPNYVSPLAISLAHSYALGLVGVGTTDLVVLASGRTADPGVVTAALNAGKAIVFDPTLIGPDGTIGVEAAGPFLSPQGVPSPAFFSLVHEQSIPAIAVPRSKDYPDLPAAFVGVKALADLHWGSVEFSELIDYPAADASRATAAVRAAAALGVPASTPTAFGRPVHTVDIPSPQDRLLRNGLSVAAALAGLVGAMICIALSSAEGRADLATFSAIGAAPGRRRRMGAAQGLVLAALGTLLGLAFGFWFATAARATTTSYTTVIPWRDLLAIVGSVPLAAVLIGVLGTLGRPVLTRRAD